MGDWVGVKGENLIFWVVRGVKGQKIAQNDKKNLSVTLDISETLHYMIVICGAEVKNVNISRQCFNFFKIFDFLGS